MRNFVFCIVVLCTVIACSQKKLSDRDRELQDRQQSIDTKKAELTPVAGLYQGELTGDDGYFQQVQLLLEVREVPEEDKKADPVLIPKLLGTLRFYFGDPQSGEHLDAAVTSSEFVKGKAQLTIIVSHPQFNELVITAQTKPPVLSGTWRAASLGVGGKIEARK